MKKLLNINFIFLLTSIFSSFLLLYNTCGFNIRFIIGDLCFIIFILSFSYLFKNKKLYLFIWSVILSAICIINSLYFNEYNDFVSICLIKTFNQALNLPSEAVTSVFEINDFIYLYQIVIFLLYLIFDKKEYIKNKVKFKNSFLTSFSLFVILILTLNSNDIYRISNEWNKVYKARNFGIYTYQLSDVIYNTFKYVKPNKTINLSVKEKVANEYTNIFKDRNVIFIHAESVQSMFLDKTIDGVEITPNLNKLKETGLYFSNFYSQESVGTSSDTEYTFYTSLLPIGVGTTFLDFESNNFNTIQKALKNNGYYTFSMHGNTCEYWNRNKMYPKFSYDKYYCYDTYDLTDKIGLGLSDTSFFLQSADIINSISDKKFAATLIMLSNHTPFYTNGKIDFNTSYLEGTMLGSYLKLLNYADKSIGLFIDKLDKLKLLDNTVVVIYGDHDAKLKKENYDMYYNYDANLKKIKDKNDPSYVSIDFYKYEEISKVPLIIWSKDNIVNDTVDKVMGMIDLYPTIANMLGIDYGYTLGNDIFSIEDNIVVFPNGNWLTDKVYYNNQYSEYKLYSDVEKNYIEEKEKLARSIVEISNDILKYNLSY